MRNEFQEVIQRLPKGLREQLGETGPEESLRVQEIRLCVGGPVALNVMGTLTSVGEPLTESQLMDCFFSLCGHSVHTYEEQLAEGFFTIEGGHRVGVAGELRYKEGCPVGFKRISALNIRIAGDFSIALPKRITDFLEKDWGNLLIVGPPGSGKTTILRGIIEYLLQKRSRFTVVDTRQELVSSPVGAPYYVCSREDGILYSLRGMNPQFILCDEIATRADISAIEQAMGAGVRMIASLHGTYGEELEGRLRSMGMGAKLFREYIFLKGSHTPGQFREEQA